MTLTDLWGVLNSGGVPALLFIIVYGGAKQWYVYGWQYRAKVRECEQWQQMALHGTQLAERGARIAEKSLTTLSPEGDKI